MRYFVFIAIQGVESWTQVPVKDLKAASRLIRSLDGAPNVNAARIVERREAYEAVTHFDYKKYLFEK